MPTPASIDAFFHEATNTVTYLVSDPATREAAIVDPVLDYDPATGTAGTQAADEVLAAAHRRGLHVAWILETHVHADHLSAAPYLKRLTGASIGIGEYVRDVQRVFRPVFNLDDLSGDGAEFDALFRDGQTFRVGGLEVRVLHTPGHTPACVSYLVGDALFAGDTLFMPDYGTARADFPGGDAAVLYRSIRKLLALAPRTRVFVCHDYKAPGRQAYAWETTVALQRRLNIHARDGVTEAEFVAQRRARDATLSAPKLLLPAIQTNLRGRDWPQAEANGVRYLRIPLTGACFNAAPDSPAGAR